MPPARLWGTTRIDNVIGRRTRLDSCFEDARAILSHSPFARSLASGVFDTCGSAAVSPLLRVPRCVGGVPTTDGLRGASDSKCVEEKEDDSEEGKSVCVFVGEDHESCQRRIVYGPGQHELK